jgi:uncharacterized protein (TIGR02186 family)
VRRLLILALIVTAALARDAAAERLTVALSTPEVKIDSNFTGTGITVFGVIERDTASVTRTAGYQIAVIVRGPGEDVIARRKERFLGIWANSGSETFVGAPSFYAAAASTTLSALASQDQLRRLQLGLTNIPLVDARPGSAADQRPYREAFLRLKQGAGLYSETTGVDFIGDTIFRATVWIPANVPVGKYRASVMLFSDGAPIATAEQWLLVSKTGFEQVMFAVSRRQALLYGLGTVIVALFTGWLAGVIFRRD